MATKLTNIIDYLTERYEVLISQLLRFRYNKVNREKYISSLVKKHFPEDDGTLVEKAISESLLSVFSEDHCKRIYRRMMWNYGIAVFICSFLLTLVPDNLIIIILSGAADLIFFQCILFIAMQKIMMLYGQECDLNNKTNESREKLIAIDSSGLMLGKYPLLQKMKSVLGWLSKQVVKRVGPKIIAKVSQSTFIVLRRQGIKWISVILTRENLQVAFDMVIPVTCAVISGIVSVVIFVPMCNKLRKHLIANIGNKNLVAENGNKQSE